MRTGVMIASFQIDEPLGVAWMDQLLCRRIEFAQPVRLQTLVLKCAGSEDIPFQVTDCTDAGGGCIAAATLWFRCDMPASGQIAYTLIQDDGVIPADSATVQRDDDSLVLATAEFRVKVPASQALSAPQPATQVPGPLLGFSAPGRPWIGGSQWETGLTCTGITTEITAQGRLWTEICVRYDFEHDAWYRMTLRLEAGRQYAVIDEQMALRFDGQVVLDLYRGFAPDRFYGRNMAAPIAADGHSKDEAIAYGSVLRLREIQMPPIGTYYVPHLAGYVGLYNTQQVEHGLIGIVGLDGEDWEYAIHNRMWLGTRGECNLVLEMPAKAGRRRWALMLTDIASAVVTGAGQQSSLLALQIRQSQVTLRQALTMRLEASAAAPGLLFDEGVLQRARTRLKELPRFRAHLDEVETGAAQDAAFGYVMTGRRAYAEQAREGVLAGLREMFNRLHLGGTADGSFTTISLSRSLRAWLATIDLIRHEAGLLDGPEGREIARWFLYFAYRMHGEGIWPHGRTALHQDHPESQKPLYNYPGDVLPDVPYWINCLPNFQSDWLIALAMIGMAYPGHPQAQDWVDAAVEDMDAQLDAFIFPTGAWVESMNYALYTLNYFTHFFLMLKHAGRRDYFADARVLRWLDWHTRMLTPPDPRIGGLQTQAYVGNAILPDGQSATFNWMAQHISDRELAGRLVEIWKRAGSPEFAHPGPGLFEALLDPDQPAAPMPVTGSTLEPGFGAILRCDEDTAEETYLTFKVGPVFSHYEGDELSFHWHARGVPLCSEYGVYQPTSSWWDSHNVVEIPARDSIRRGYLADACLDDAADYLVGVHPGLVRYYVDYPESFRDPKEGQFGQKYNYLDHEAPLGPKIWLRRALLFIKPHYLVLLDDVDGVTPSRFNLHCVADGLTEVDGGVHFAGRFGMDLSVFIAAPERYSLLTGRHAPEKGPVDHSQLFIRIVPDGPNHYHTVLYPHRRQENISFRRLEDGVGIEVNGPLGQDRIWLSRQTHAYTGEDFAIRGTAAFTRANTDGVSLHLLRGSYLAAYGYSIDGEGPVHLEQRASGELLARVDGPARRVTISHAGQRQELNLAPGKQSIIL